MGSKFSAVLQTDFSPGRGNALQACVASIFSLELESVPNFVTAPEGYENAIRTWLEARARRFHKVQLEDGRLPSNEACWSAQLCMLRGTSPRGDHGHVVVAKVSDNGTLQIVHDPHPDGSGLKPPLVWAA